MPESTALRIGVVGVGQRAALARHVAAVEGADVVVCADPDPRGQAYGRELFGPDVAVRSDYRDLLDEGLDGVIITTPDDRHTQPVLDLLRSGVAVLVEKPLAITIADCDEILETAMATGTRLYVGHNLRHAAACRALRSVVETGEIGAVKAVWCRHFVGHGGDFYFKDWHAERARTTGLLLQKGAHDIDVIHWLAGGVCRDVVALGSLDVYDRNPRRDPATPRPARMQDWYDPSLWPPAALRDLNPVIDVEDISMMLGRLDNGVLVSYQQCHFTPDYWRNYTVIGDAGRVENFGDLAGATIKIWNTRRSGYREDADRTITVAGGEEGHGGADRELVAEWLRFVRAGGPTETSPLAAREAVAAGVAATESLRHGGRPVQVPAPRPEVARYFADHQVR
jgi:predicted dehydrogenase